MAEGKLKVGSRAWEKSLGDSPRHAQAAIESLTRRAAEGEPGAAEQLARWLARHPEFAPAVAAVSDLSTRALETWFKLTADGDRQVEQSARDEAAAIRTELLPPDAGVVERVLVDAVVVARLILAHATALAAFGSTVPGVTAARDRRLSSAQVRFATAVKAVQTIAAKRAKGVKPALKLFEHARQAGP